MFHLTSEDMLVRTFRPRDQRKLERPAGITYPHFVRHYLAWGDAVNGNAHIVFGPPGGAPTGIYFRRGSGGDSQMCEWCHSSGGPHEIGLLTADVNSRKRVGITVCLDLRCQEKIEDAANRAGRNPQDATRAMMERICRFATEGLGIDLSGVGRP